MFYQHHAKSFIPQIRPEDEHEQRLGKLFKPLSLNELLKKPQNAAHYLLMGFADDRGVVGNFGRAGAAQGPKSFRQEFYKMTAPKNFGALIDLGDIEAKTFSTTKAAHQWLAEENAKIKLLDLKTISIGGGHDWAYPDFLQFCTSQDNKRRLVINIDAHLDMRPDALEEDRAEHSGSPFRHLVEACTNATHFLTIGLQQHCNQEAHLDWARQKGAEFKFWDEDLSLIDQTLNSFDEIAFSICLDAFPAAFAPGVSAPQALGVDPNFVYRLIKSHKEKIRQLGIYELNPKFDIDHRSAKLAATLAYAYL